MIAITNNPYQGLKRGIYSRHMDSRTIAITNNPYQGLKQISAKQEFSVPIAITNNPYQGLKLPSLPGRLQGFLHCNYKESLSRIETALPALLESILQLQLQRIPIRD